jgi:hypothetical protein
VWHPGKACLGKSLLRDRPGCVLRVGNRAGLTVSPVNSSSTRAHLHALDALACEGEHVHQTLTTSR